MNDGTGLGWPGGAERDPRQLSTGLGWPVERVPPQDDAVSPQADGRVRGPRRRRAVSRETSPLAASPRVRTAGDLSDLAPGFDDETTPLARAAEHSVLARLGAREPRLDAPPGAHPGGGGRQPEGRRRQDHHDGERRRRAGPARPAGAGGRPRPPGQRLDRARRRAPPRRPVDVRRPGRRRRRSPRSSTPVDGLDEPLGGAGHHRPGRRRDRAGQPGGPREPAAPRRWPRIPASAARTSPGRPTRLRLHRLPAVARACSPSTPWWPAQRC